MEASATARGRSPCLHASQNQIHSALRKAFPEAWLAGVPSPCLEDILNLHVFTAFASWRKETGTALPLGNTLGWAGEGHKSAMLGRQGGALTSQKALPALIGTCDSDEAHFAACLKFGSQGRLPFDSDLAAPLDLQFAASQTAKHIRRIREWRASCSGALQELSDRLQPVSSHLRRYQPATVSAVAGQIHVALIAILTWVCGWPDHGLARRFIEGFPLLGRAESTGIFVEKECAEPVSRAQILADSEAMLAALRTDRASDEAEFLWESCCQEHASGWAAAFGGQHDMDAQFGRRQWAPIPSFVVCQAGGKRRRVDNARRFGHNSGHAPCDQMKMCCAFQPAVSARALRCAAGCDGEKCPDLWQLQSGGEDLPSAYRSLPVLPEDIAVNVVVARHPRSPEGPGWAQGAVRVPQDRGTVHADVGAPVRMGFQRDAVHTLGDFPRVLRAPCARIVSR